MPTLDITDEQRRELRETGKITFTQEQLDARFASEYARTAFDYGLQCLGAGRFALAGFFAPVGASLLHHALEMFLKGTLAQGDQASAIRLYWKTYGHRLGDLWRAVCERHPSAGLEKFERTIAALDKFEEIRFPEDLVAGGALIEIGFGDPIPGGSGGTAAPAPDRQFRVGMPQIDLLVRRLFEVSDFSPEFFATLLRNQHAAPFFALRNDSPLLR